MRLGSNPITGLGNMGVFRLTAPCRACYVEDTRYGRTLTV